MPHWKFTQFEIAGHIDTQVYNNVGCKMGFCFILLNYIEIINKLERGPNNMMITEIGINCV